VGEFYTGGFLTFVGIPLAIGIWTGALVTIVVSMIAYLYRILIEEEALQEAFGSEYEEFKKGTKKLFPGF
jgi:protein-S-isoprenylcysteine O-methyltransferase Ste14